LGDHLRVREVFGEIIETDLVVLVALQEVANGGDGGQVTVAVWNLAKRLKTTFLMMFSMSS
jgi:hypothetical protein